MKKSIIAKREDGFVISYATFKDFKNLKKFSEKFIKRK